MEGQSIDQTILCRLWGIGVEQKEATSVSTDSKHSPEHTVKRFQQILEQTQQDALDVKNMIEDITAKETA